MASYQKALISDKWKKLLEVYLKIYIRKVGSYQKSERK